MLLLESNCLMLILPVAREASGAKRCRKSRRYLQRHRRNPGETSVSRGYISYLLLTRIIMELPTAMIEERVSLWEGLLW